MAVQKEAPAGGRQAPASAGTGTGVNSRNSTGTSIASSSGRSSKSPGPTRPNPTARGAVAGAGVGRSRNAPAAVTPPRAFRGAAGGTAGGSSGSTPYRYLVLPGNESVLLREALERRPWWAPVPAAPAGATSQKGKDGASAASAAAAAQQQRWNLWAGLNGQRFAQFDLLQPGAAGTAAADGTDPASRRLVNRLQEHRLVCTKSGLAGVLAALKASGGGGSGGPAAAGAADASAADVPGSGSGASTRGSRPLDLNWIPETYVVPAGPKALTAGGGGGGGALGRFKAAFARHAAAGRRVWIAKPTCLNRGNGIEVYDNLDRIMEHIKGRPAGSNLILQKYIERPLLLGGRKFDIRAYVLVGPDGSVWFHKEAYCRTSSTPYDSNDLANRSAHLTNDAVQKHLDTYNAFEDHCKMSLEELGPALRRAAAPAAPSSAPSASSPSPSSSVLSSLDTCPGSETGLWGAMRRCVAALFSAADPLTRLNPRRLGHCFELLGLDFMLDDEGGLYLIEVNTSPALFRAGAYLTDLLPRLVEEVAQKVVDPLFPPPPPPPRPPNGAEADAASAATVVAGRTIAGPAPAGAEQARGEPAAAAAWPLLDGFVRVELDEQLAAATAAAAATGGRAGKAARASSPRPPGARAAVTAVGGKGAAGATGSRGPAAVATVAVGGGVRVGRTAPLG